MRSIESLSSVVLMWVCCDGCCDREIRFMLATRAVWWSEGFDRACTRLNVGDEDQRLGDVKEQEDLALVPGD